VTSGGKERDQDASPSGNSSGAVASLKRPYITFRKEEPDDYTDGPARMIGSFDGKKRCVSLLMTMELSAAIQAAISGQRKFDRQSGITRKRLSAVINLQLDLSHEIKIHERRITALGRERERDPGAVKVAALQEELSLLKEMAENLEFDGRRLQSDLEGQERDQRECQTTVTRLLEDAFVYAKLADAELKAPASPTKRRDLQAEYAMYRRRRTGRDDDDPVTPLDVSREDLRASRTAEVERKLTAAYRATHEPMRQAQAAFDAKEQTRDAAWQAHRQPIADRTSPDYLSAEDFDCQWLKYFQKLTHNLVVADADYDNAKARLLAAGFETGKNIEPSISVRVRDYGLDDEIKLSWVGPKAQPRVNRWLEAIEDPESPMFDECRTEIGTMGPWESFSSYAQGDLERKRIDAYHAACEAGVPFVESAPAAEPELDPSNLSDYSSHYSR